MRWQIHPTISSKGTFLKWEVTVNEHLLVYTPVWHSHPTTLFSSLLAPIPFPLIHTEDVASNGDETFAIKVPSSSKPFFANNTLQTSLPIFFNYFKSTYISCSCLIETWSLFNHSRRIHCKVVWAPSVGWGTINQFAEFDKQTVLEFMQICFEWSGADLNAPQDSPEHTQSCRDKPINHSTATSGITPWVLPLVVTQNGRSTWDHKQHLLNIPVFPAIRSRIDSGQWVLRWI